MMEMFPSFEMTLALAKKRGTAPEVLGLMEHDAKEATLNITLLREQIATMKGYLMRAEQKWRLARKEVFELKARLKNERKRAKK